MPTAINSQMEFMLIRMHLYVQLPTNFLREKAVWFGKKVCINFGVHFCSHAPIWKANILKMETSNICETLALTYRSTRRHMPKGNLQSHRRENAKTHSVSHDSLHSTHGVSQDCLCGSAACCTICPHCYLVIVTNAICSQSSELNCIQ
jgi:hypothetical protein